MSEQFDTHGEAVQALSYARPCRPESPVARSLRSWAGLMATLWLLGHDTAPARPSRPPDSD